MLIARKPYPSDVSDDELALVAAYPARCCRKNPGNGRTRCARCSTAMVLMIAQRAVVWPRPFKPPPIKA